MLHALTGQARSIRRQVPHALLGKRGGIVLAARVLLPLVAFPSPNKREQSASSYC